MPSISIVVLTYNRRDSADELLRHLRGLESAVVETILVDNASSDGTGDLVATGHAGVRYIRSEENLGACGRNLGIEAAAGDLVITLDDDIFGLTPADLDRIRDRFVAQPELAALNFQVNDYFTGRVCNWVHHYPSTRAEERFETYELTEGAVVFRRRAVEEVGAYWPEFFIGHEGPDLAFRLMDAGYTVAYDGGIVVRHKHEQQSRVSWRFYYYDTRNQFWLAARRMRALMALRYLVVGLGAMAVYSARDGFVSAWFRAVLDGVRGLPAAWRTRAAMTRRTEARVREIDRGRPGFWSQVRKRLFEPANRLDG